MLNSRSTRRSWPRTGNELKVRQPRADNRLSKTMIEHRKGKNLYGPPIGGRRFLQHPALSESCPVPSELSPQLETKRTRPLPLAQPNRCTRPLPQNCVQELSSTSTRTLLQNCLHAPNGPWNNQAKVQSFAEERVLETLFFSRERSPLRVALAE